MPPVHPMELIALTAETLVTDVLHPAAIESRAAMQAEAWCSLERVDLETARAANYKPVETGWRWGPVWSTAWFRLRGVLPPGEGTPALRFSSGTEALVHLPDGQSWHGLDMNRDLARLPDNTDGDLELHVEAACNRPLGATLFWWDPAEEHARWKEDSPGRFGHAELVRVHEPTWRLAVAMDFAIRLLRALPIDTPETHCVADALAAVGVMIDDGPAAATRHAVPAALAAMEAALQGAPESTSVIAVGHAHIDTAWLWPVAETRRKVRRSWATALRLMDRYDDFRFTASQTQQYAWLEEDDPALLDAIGRRIADGRWEANGAMWIEPDCQVPSGESLVRQFIHGTAWWTDRFGENARQSVLYLPDTFGFPASLPQLIEQAGLDRFITNKICWNEVTVFPHVDFTWQGIDGTQVQAHFTPGHTYNAALEPKDLIGAQANAMADGHARSTAWLQPFGYGDGGGGPTDAMIERARLSASCAGLPAVRMGHLRDFERPASSQQPAIWDGELYLEMHRGTFTSQGWLKRANLAAEEALRLAEILSNTTAADRIDTRAALDGTWKRLLLQQFHDILPGSSITAVYEEARCDMASVQSEAAARVDVHLDTGDHVLNPASTPRQGVLDAEDGPRWHAMAAPLGTAPMTDTLPDDVTPVTVDGLTLDNGLLSCRIGDDGAVHDLRSVQATRALEGLEGRGLGQLTLFRDRPRRWEAWDIDRQYEAHPVALDAPSAVQVVECSPLRAIIEVKRSIGEASSCVQRYVLRAGSPVLEVQADIDWAESQRLLRCIFPTDLRAADASFGIQFGHVRRAAHRNMPFDEARFEVPGHRWMDLSERGCGLAVLDCGVYGKSACHGQLGLSLLRAPNFPDPEADRGRHQLRWGLMPHGGDALQHGVVAEAEAFAGRGPVASTPREAPFALQVSCPAAVEISAYKGAQDDNGRIVRLVEMHGAHGTATIDWPESVQVTACDLHERPVELTGLGHDSIRTTIPLRPFGVVTLRIEGGA